MIANLPFQSPEGEIADPSLAYALLYGLRSCEHCAEAKALLQNLGVPFAATFLDELSDSVRRPALAKLRKIHGDKIVFPILEIHGEMIFGFNRDTWTKRLQPAMTR